jgi:hypothetical protein
MAFEGERPSAQKRRERRERERHQQRSRDSASRQHDVEFRRTTDSIKSDRSTG